MALSSFCAARGCVLTSAAVVRRQWRQRRREGGGGGGWAEVGAGVDAEMRMSWGQGGSMRSWVALLWDHAATFIPGSDVDCLECIC